MFIDALISIGDTINSLTQCKEHMEGVSCLNNKIDFEDKQLINE